MESIGSETLSCGTSYWIKFFKDAGIPAGVAASYAISFTDNRIQFDMLPDLNTELLAYMSITVVGDVIAILKHAKLVHAEKLKEKALGSVSDPKTAAPRKSVLLTSTTTTTTTTTTTSPSKSRSRPAQRIVEHYLGSDVPSQTISTPVVSKQLAARLGPTNAPEKSCDVVKSSVFKRLGGMKKTVRQQVEDVSSSLLTQSPAVISTRRRTSSSDDNSSVLEYAGILKGLSQRKTPSTTVSRKRKVSVQNTQVTKKPAMLRLRVEESSVSIRRCGLLNMDTEGDKKSAHQRIGGAVVTAATTTTTISKPAMSMKNTAGAVNKSSGIKSRLGLQRSEVSSSADVISTPTPPTGQSVKHTGVFQRLGAPKTS